MKIGYGQFVINPPFPVNRMLSDIKHQTCADDLHCRILMLEKDGKTPFYHVSIDTVEIYLDYRNLIKETIEKKLGHPIDLVTSATHSHFCPCLTTDQNYRKFLLEQIYENVDRIEVKECEKLYYSFDSAFFDKTGKSRISKQDSRNIFAQTLCIYADKARVATVLMYNSHATTMKMKHGDFTSEYIGWVIRELRDRYPGEFFTFMLGPAGDISSRFTRESQEYEEIARLASFLKDEYILQLDNYRYLKEINEISYEEKWIPIDRKDVDYSGFEIPDYITGRERETIEMAINSPIKEKKEERPDKHLFSHLCFSDDYSIIFEPFEMFSSYYDAVDKRHCSLVTISNGFDHYLCGIGPQRITMELFSDNVTYETKCHIIELFHKWSEGSVNSGS